MTFVVRYNTASTNYDFAWGLIESGSLPTSPPKRVERIMTPGVSGSRARVRDDSRAPIVMLLILPMGATLDNRTTEEDIVTLLQGSIGTLTYKWDASDSQIYPNAVCLSITVVDRMGLLIGFGEVLNSPGSTMYRVVFDTPSDPV